MQDTRCVARRSAVNRILLTCWIGLGNPFVIAEQSHIHTTRRQSASDARPRAGLARSTGISAAGQDALQAASERSRAPSVFTSIGRDAERTCLGSVLRSCAAERTSGPSRPQM